MSKPNYYAVRVGHNPGIYTNWADCEKQVKGFSNAKFKGFVHKSDALDFIMLKDEFLDKAPPTKSNPPPTSHQSPLASRPVSRPPVASPHVPDVLSSPIRPYPLPTPIQSTPVVNPPKPYLLPTPAHLVPNINFSGSAASSHNFDSNSLKIQIPNTSGHTSQKRKITVLETNKKEGPNAAASTSKNISESVSMTFNSPKKPLLDNKPAASSSGYGSIIQRQIAFIRSEKIPFSFNREKVSVYTDGACSNNGQKDAVAGIGVFWGPNHKLNVSTRLLGMQTNNRAEIMAAIIALGQAIEYGASEVNLYTDSQYTINCINQWIMKWKRNGWKAASNQPVKNVDELMLLDDLRNKIKTNWIHVRGHNGDFGNEEADRLARESLNRP